MPFHPHPKAWQGRGERRGGGAAGRNHGPFRCCATHWVLRSPAVVPAAPRISLQRGEVRPLEGRAACAPREVLSPGNPSWGRLVPPSLRCCRPAGWRAGGQTAAHSTPGSHALAAPSCLAPTSRASFATASGWWRGPPLHLASSLSEWCVPSQSIIPHGDGQQLTRCVSSGRPPHAWPSLSENWQNECLKFTRAPLEKNIQMELS